jgi:hypothetical protein
MRKLYNVASSAKIQTCIFVFNPPSIRQMYFRQIVVSLVLIHQISDPPEYLADPPKDWRIGWGRNEASIGSDSFRY